MNGADVSRIGSGRNRNPSVLKYLQILERHVISMLDSIKNGIRVFKRLLHSIRQLIWRNFGDVERGDYFGITPRLFFSCQIQLVGEGAAVALEHDQGWAKNRAFFLEQADERLIDGFINNAVDQQIGAFFHRGPRRFQLGRVHGDT